MPAPTPLPASAIENALIVVQNPELFHDQPDALITAWHVLKTQRGERFNHLRIKQMLRALRPVSNFTPYLGLVV